MRTLALAILLAVIVGVQQAEAVNIEAADTAAMKAWLANVIEPSTPVAPFSFVYGGAASADLLPGWTVTREQMPAGGGSGFRTVWTCPKTGLQIRMDGVVFADFPVIEWTLYLKNTGAADTPLLEAVQALNMQVPVSNGDPRLRYAKGGTCSFEDFRPMERVLNKEGRTHLQPGGGRSSSDFLPFFNLEYQPEKRLIVGIGWSGEWAADFFRDKQGDTVQVECGMAHTHLVLHAGEEIRTPRVALLFCDGGPWVRAQNVWRAFLLAHHRPMPDGKPLEPLSLNGNWGGTSAADHLANIRAIAEHDLPMEYYWIDAEWFGGPKWHKSPGDWAPRAELYPDGFKPLADALHASGRKLLLWFEPERVCEGTPWYEAHKEWLLEVPKEQRHYCWGRSQADPDWVAWESARNQICENDQLFNLGDPEARAFLTDFISDRITEYGLDCFRHDANIAPFEFWRAADAPDREGMTEIRWVEGLYAFWDELLKRHPGLIIDNCASGGRRIDLESLSRATPYWRTDFPAGPAVKQCHTYGLSFWVPLNATGAFNPAKEDAYAGRSTWSGSMVFELLDAGEAAKAKGDPALFDFAKAKAALQEYRDVRGYFLGDYYPITAYSQAEDAWMGWQFHRADLNAGMVQMFRRPGSICESGHISLQGLDPQAAYTIENLDSHETCVMTGQELLEKKLPVLLPEAPLSLVLVYKRNG